ncbi:hypothetical protein [Mucilaginibacter arboris]|uniref:Uncharacterized protein n=1 Tax=Mucilaginibacter arboris TaxID=2682090 RepID=A0A7K1T131_9SPHI|nr:hypothetical protein [Mucilaginibacter arboris]MVN23283.1 hypothetical protein [Mucilaginibacter arboris]
MQVGALPREGLEGFSAQHRSAAQPCKARPEGTRPEHLKRSGEQGSQEDRLESREDRIGKRRI